MLINVEIPPEFAANYLKEIKKDYQKMKEACMVFEKEHASLCRQIGLDMDAFNIVLHPDHPAEGAFRPIKLSDSDKAIVGEYLGNRERMYVLEQCVRSIKDDNIRKLAEAYYIERKTMDEVGLEVGHGKSYVSKKLSKAEADMPGTVSRYFEWKHGVPGGKDCFWAGDWEKKHMWFEDYRHGNIRLLDAIDTSWMEKIKRLGFKD